MAETGSISTGIAGRYATAVFELAKESGSLATIETDVDTLDQALKDSADFRELIASPVYSRDAQDRAVAALAEKMGLSEIVRNTLRLMASKRRLFVLPHFAAQLQDLIAAEKGEVTAEVVAAKSMTKAQQDRLSKSLRETVGKDVKINLSVDESLIGGLVVKVGSKMIDTSIRSKLNSLQNAMKEVG